MLHYIDFGLPLYAALKQCENPVPVRYPSGMPMTMRHIKTVEWKDYPHSISHYRDITYVGTQVSKVIALDRRTGMESVFVTIESRKPAPSTPWKPYSLFEVRRRPTRSNTTDRESDWGTSVTVHNDLVYILINKKSGNHSVQVRDLTGKFIRKWGHQGHKDGYSKLRVVGDQLIILNNEDNTIAVYTLDGKLVKKLPYPHMKNSWTSLAACGDNSIIISDYLTGIVSRVDLDIGEIIWTSTHVPNPEGVVCYKNRYVLVTNRNSDARIWILDIDSGMFKLDLNLSLHTQCTSSLNSEKMRLDLIRTQSKVIQGQIYKTLDQAGVICNLLTNAFPLIFSIIDICPVVSVV